MSIQKDHLETQLEIEVLLKLVCYVLWWEIKIYQIVMKLYGPWIHKDFSKWNAAIYSFYMPVGMVKNSLDQ